jgi:hypothetical protein
MSQELPEDNPLMGIKDLQKFEAKLENENTTKKPRILFIGITCGISAPYVMGQIDYAMHKVLFIYYLE